MQRTEGRILVYTLDDVGRSIRFGLNTTAIEVVILLTTINIYLYYIILFNFVGCFIPQLCLLSFIEVVMILP